MTESPQDYGLPLDHGEWRPSQKEALDIILAMKNPSTIILEFPTGGGKTALAAAMATKDKVLAMMLTKDLQDQYSRGYGFDVIYGRGNYPCVESYKVKRWQDAYGFVPTADDCSNMKECLEPSCPYKLARAIAKDSQKTAMNYAYAWASEWWHEREGYLFADEAHNLAISTISNLAQLEVSERQLRRWDLPDFPHCSGTMRWAIDDVVAWIDEARPVLKHKAGLRKDPDPFIEEWFEPDSFTDEMLKGSTIADKKQKERKQAKKLLSKLLLLKDIIWKGTWYIRSSNIGEPHLSCRPINPSVFAPRLLGYHRQKILMSATIGDASMLANELGIPQNEYEFYSFPHNISPERRPVYMTDAPAMSYKSTWQDYEHQADVIAGICYQHKGERILIHTTRWKHAQDLVDRLTRKGLQDRVWIPSRTEGRLEQVAKLTNPSYTDLIAIGPSFWEGLDLKDDLCRCVIVAKIPWSDRSDPVVAARLRQEGGGKWDRWCAALKVVQGCGRAVRDAEDFAVAYIADGSWNRVASYAPKWFSVET